MNEPWCGDIFKRPELLIPSFGDRENLAPFYEILNTAIRKEDTDHIIYFESVTWDDIVEVGFKNVPGGPQYRDRSVLSYHFYKQINLNINIAFRERMKDIVRLGCGGFLTEFEMGDNSDIGIQNLIQTLNYTDHYIQSWTGWEYKSYVPITGYNDAFFNSDGTFKPAVKYFSRTYAPAVAGYILSMQFNPSNSIFELVYYINTNCQAPTEIYLNEEFYYSKGFNITFSPFYLAQYAKIEKNRIFIKHTGIAITGDKLTVKIVAL